MQRLKYFQGQGYKDTKKQRSEAHRDKDIEAGEYRQRLMDTQRWRYTDAETETNRMYNT